jgi:hypothetical protein
MGLVLENSAHRSRVHVRISRAAPRSRSRALAGLGKVQLLVTMVMGTLIRSSPRWPSCEQRWPHPRGTRQWKCGSHCQCRSRFRHGDPCRGPELAARTLLDEQGSRLGEERGTVYQLNTLKFSAGFPRLKVIAVFRLGLSSLSGSNRRTRGAIHRRDLIWGYCWGYSFAGR